MSLLVGGHSWWTGGGGGGSSTGGKSAVQLLQESKSQYVKSDHVLGTCQKPARPDRFHISSNPNIFLKAPSHSLHATRLSPDPPRRSQNSSLEESFNASNNTSATANSNQTVSSKSEEIPNIVATLTPSALAEHTNAVAGKSFKSVTPMMPVRIQRGAPRPRPKTQPIGDSFSRGVDLRRSLSHGQSDRASNGEDIQMKLRKLLLDIGSKEKIYPESPTRTPSKKKSFVNGEGVCGTFRAEPANVTVHKSLPELYKSAISSFDIEAEKRRPSCPGAFSNKKEPMTNPVISLKSTQKSPPPVPPRKFRDGIRPLPLPPEVPKKPVARLPPPKIPPRTLTSSQRDEFYNSISLSTVPAIPVVDPYRRSSDSDASCTGASSEDTRRRPILRSKSDVTYERCSLGQKYEAEEATDCGFESDVISCSPSSSRVSPSDEDLERFFENMGLDTNTYQEVMSPTIVGDGSSPVYFDEKSSEDSLPRRCSSDDEGQGKQTPLRPGEPSIIEKNARVIKWLFTCQRAQGCLAQRNNSKSS